MMVHVLIARLYRKWCESGTGRMYEIHVLPHMEHPHQKMLMFPNSTPNITEGNTFCRETTTTF